MSNQKYFQGFEKEINGMRFGYHSPLPDVNKSLLVRGQANYAPIVWETEIVPKTYDRKTVSFIWIFAMDVTPVPVNFTLSVNNRKYIQFQNSKKSILGQTTFKGKDNAELTLNVTMLDNAEDQMGFAILTVPVAAIKKGAPTQLAVSAEPSNNTAWFMTFKSGIEEKVDIYQNHVVVKEKNKLLHSISLDFIHIGDDAKANIQVGSINKNATLKAGFNKVELNLSKVDELTEYEAIIKIEDKKPIQKSFSIKPVKEWEIFLVQHTHSDIGYTRPQTEILPEHLRYIDHALDYCDQTDDYPDASKFRWTCETSWSVREYLRSRPQHQIDRLIRRIKEGRIEATGMFLNYSEIVDESALAAQTKTLKMLKNSGIDVTTAMQNDVNGIAWCLVDYFNQTDVKYLTMGIHAHRARKPFDKPTAFWWQSPAGNRLLAYRSEHYMHGNSLSLTTGQQDVFRSNLSNYLNGLEMKGYPYNKISLQFSGYITDNSPPSVKVCDIIKAWNEKYEWPKLRSALAKDFMILLDEKHNQDIPTQKVAWPDWWTDGVGSAANETKVVRKTHVEAATNTAILSMAKLQGAKLPENIQYDIEQVYDNLLFYDEHTHGAAESVSDPLALNTINQWGMKSSYAWEAAKKSTSLQEKALAFLEPSLSKSTKPRIAIFNTLNWERSGMVELFIEYEVIPPGEDFIVVDAENREIPFQVFQRRQEGAYYGLWVDNIPPFGFKTLEIKVGKKNKLAPKTKGEPYENQYYKLAFDQTKGSLKSIYDKNLNLELIDPQDSLGLGNVIYEKLENRHELERLTNTNRDTVYRPLSLSRSILQNLKVEKTENGSIFKSVYLKGELPEGVDDRGVLIEIRLFHHHKKIEFLYSLFKLPVYAPEAIYVSFPFKLNQGKLAFEAQGGVVYPGINQLEGSSSDWNTIQNFAAVKNDESQIVFVSNEIPLVQFGAINTGRYYYRLKPKTNHIYSWVLNNYWVTNFKASQHGELHWTYNITSSADHSDMFATKFGWSDRTPLLSRVILADENATENILTDRSLINLATPGLLLVSSAPSMDNKGIILHLREIEGRKTKIDMAQIRKETGATSLEHVSVLEEQIMEIDSDVIFDPYETKFIKLVLDD